MVKKKEKITTEEVRYVAKLSRLILTDNEEKSMTRTLNDILGYMDKLGELDTTDVEPMTHAIPNENVMRNDVEKPFANPEGILKNAPDSKRTFFRVPRVIE